MGTALRAAGWPAQLPAQQANGDRPDLVAEVHAGYVAAGAEVILTNTLVPTGTPAATRAVELARAAAADGWVLASVGPWQPDPASKNQPPTQVCRLIDDVAAAVPDDGIDGFMLETFCDVRQAATAARKAALAGSALIIASFHFAISSRGRLETPAGDTPEEVATVMADAGALAIGANCGGGLSADQWAELTSRLVAAGRLPVIMRPSAGLPAQSPAGMSWPISPAEFAQIGTEMARRGASGVGGCCGTTAGHLTALRRRLRAG